MVVPALTPFWSYHFPMRSVGLTVVLVWAGFATADEQVSFSDTVKAQVQPSFDAPIQTFECDAGNGPRFRVAVFSSTEG